jgi:hypothetical protein
VDPAQLRLIKFIAYSLKKFGLRYCKSSYLRKLPMFDSCLVNDDLKSVLTLIPFHIPERVKYVLSFNSCSLSFRNCKYNTELLKSYQEIKNMILSKYPSLNTIKVLRDKMERYNSTIIGLTKGVIRSKEDILSVRAKIDEYLKFCDHVIEYKRVNTNELKDYNEKYDLLYQIVVNICDHNPRLLKKIPNLKYILLCDEKSKIHINKNNNYLYNYVTYLKNCRKTCDKDIIDMCYKKLFYKMPYYVVHQLMDHSVKCHEVKAHVALKGISGAKARVCNLISRFPDTFKEIFHVLQSDNDKLARLETLKLISKKENIVTVYKASQKSTYLSALSKFDFRDPTITIEMPYVNVYRTELRFNDYTHKAFKDMDDEEISNIIQNKLVNYFQLSSDEKLYMKSMNDLMLKRMNSRGIYSLHRMSIELSNENMSAPCIEFFRVMMCMGMNLTWLNIIDSEAFPIIYLLSSQGVNLARKVMIIEQNSELIDKLNLLMLKILPIAPWTKTETQIANVINPPKEKIMTTVREERAKTRDTSGNKILSLTKKEKNFTLPALAKNYVSGGLRSYKDVLTDKRLHKLAKVLDNKIVKKTLGKILDEKKLCNLIADDIYTVKSREKRKSGRNSKLDNTIPVSDIVDFKPKNRKKLDSKIKLYDSDKYIKKSSSFEVREKKIEAVQMKEDLTELRTLHPYKRFKRTKKRVIDNNLRFSEYDEANKISVSKPLILYSVSFDENNICTISKSHKRKLESVYFDTAYECKTTILCERYWMYQMPSLKSNAIKRLPKRYLKHLIASFPSDSKALPHLKYEQLRRIKDNEVYYIRKKLSMMYNTYEYSKCESILISIRDELLALRSIKDIVLSERERHYTSFLKF